MPNTYQVHTYNEEKVEIAEPLNDWTMFTGEFGYITRRELLCFACTKAEIASLITSAGKADGFVQDGEVKYDFAFHPTLTIYNAQVWFVKFSSS